MSTLVRFQVLSLTLSVLSLASEAPAESRGSECFAHHEVTRVEPYLEARGSEGYVDTVLVGAQVFVLAERGLTGEWLYRELAQRVAARRSDVRCPLDIPGVRISIQSGGPGFWVNISSSSETAGQQVLERARKLMR